MLEIDADSDRVMDYEVEERLREPEQLAEAAATVHDLPQGKRKHEKQIHVLQSCQKFVMLFLVTPPVRFFLSARCLLKYVCEGINYNFLSLLQPRALSLEFASKVIHGTDLPTEVLKSRTRRLYDLANSKWYFLTFGTITAGFFYNTTWAEERGECLPNLEFFP